MSSTGAAATPLLIVVAFLDANVNPLAHVGVHTNPIRNAPI